MAIEKINNSPQPSLSKGTWISSFPDKVRLGGRKAFTLVELIIVITILTILATIAFVSFQWYTSRTRDSNRMATVKNIESGVYIFSTKTGKVPVPDDLIGIGVLNSVSLNYVWKVWKNIARIINLNDVPLDPRASEQYWYGTDIFNRFFQIWLTLESETEFIWWFSKIYASNTLEAKVQGNYDYPLKIWNNVYSLPSLLFLGSGALTNTSTFVVDKGTNVPYTFWEENTGTQSVEEVLKLVVWTWGLSLTGLSIPSVSSGDYRSSTGIPAAFLSFAQSLGLSDKSKLWVAVYGSAFNSDAAINGASLNSDAAINGASLNSDASILSEESTQTAWICGTASKVYDATESNYGIYTYCAVWISNPTSTAFPANGATVSWKCEWINGGASVDCSASRGNLPINGSCGTAKDSPAINTPTWNLCLTGNGTNVDSTNPSKYTWKCEWVNAWTDANCETVRQYNVTFESNGGDAVSHQILPYGTTASTPTVPKKTWYTFWGWYKNVWLTNAWTFVSDVVTSSTTLYAKWTLNSCATPPPHANVTTWSPTSVSQSLQNSNASNPCYYVCTWWYSGTNCSVAPTICSDWVDEITLANGQTWACKNVWATEVRDGTITFSCTTTTDCGNKPAWVWEYYQWGRNDPITWGYVATTYTGLLNDWKVWNNDLYKWDWVYADWWKNELWSSTPTRWNTVSRWPCPTNRHVPTSSEWKLACDSISETSCKAGTSVTRNSMQSKLKLPYTGLRVRNSGNYSSQSNWGYYWSRTPNQHYGQSFSFQSWVFPAENDYRAYAYAVRCIKD